MTNLVVFGRAQHLVHRIPGAQVAKRDLLGLLERHGVVLLAQRGFLQDHEKLLILPFNSGEGNTDQPSRSGRLGLRASSVVEGAGTGYRILCTSARACGRPCLADSSPASVVDHPDRTASSCCCSEAWLSAIELERQARVPAL